MCLDSAGSWKLSGILSHEGECLTRSHPDVFISVVELGDWISKTIGTTAVYRGLAIQKTLLTLDNSIIF